MFKTLLEVKLPGKKPPVYALNNAALNARSGRVKADDNVTRKWRKHLHRQQNQASRNIRKEKHGKQDRPDTN